MSMWTAIMVLGIVAMTQIARVLRAKYQAQHGIVEDRRGRVQMLAQPQDNAATAEMQREVETLRERIKVLERIATDANTTSARETRAVAAEIEALRDR
jgi:hypothetical protein